MKNENESEGIHPFTYLKNNINKKIKNLFLLEIKNIDYGSKLTHTKFYKILKFDPNYFIIK